VSIAVLNAASPEAGLEPWPEFLSEHDVLVIRVIPVNARMERSANSFLNGFPSIRVEYIAKFLVFHNIPLLRLRVGVKDYNHRNQCQYHLR